MDTTKITILTCMAIIAIAASLVIIQLIIRKEKAKSENEGKIRLAYGVLFVSCLIASLMLNIKGMTIFGEYMDTFYKVNRNPVLMPVIKTCVLFIGLINIWFVVWYFGLKVFALLFVGKKSAIIEIENDNYVYFLMTGVVFLGFINVLMPVFDIVLRFFLPDLEIPYYR